MRKTFIGTVVSTKMNHTAVVEITMRKPHPIYRKLLKTSTRLMADTAKHKVSLGDLVKIEETRPISKYKHFHIVEIIKQSSEREKEEV
jgi:small subunit ribosomal protein S17